MTLAEPEHIEPDLVGEFDLLDQVPQSLMRADSAGTGRHADMGESVEAKLHGRNPQDSWPVARDRGSLLPFAFR